MVQKFMISKMGLETLVKGTRLTFARLENKELALTEKLYQDLSVRLFQLLQLGLIAPALYKEYSLFLDGMKDSDKK